MKRAVSFVRTISLCVRLSGSEKVRLQRLFAEDRNTITCFTCRCHLRCSSTNILRGFHLQSIGPREVDVFRG
ncbi:hypothetical protein Peur_018531 [Populus x canadensis]